MATPKQISDKTAAQLVEYVDKLCRFVDSGDDPTTAAVKVAKDNGMFKEHIRLMCHGYNTGAINTQRRDGQSFTEKFAAVPLADADRAIEAVFPGEPTPILKSAAVADVYTRPLAEPLRKVAAEQPTAPAKPNWASRDFGKIDSRTPYELAKEKLAEFVAVRKQADLAEKEAVRKLAAVEDAYVDRYGKTADAVCFLRKWAGDVYGRPGQVIVDQLAARFIESPGLRDKYAAAKTDTKTFFGKTEPRTAGHPVMLAIKEAIDSSRQWLLREFELPSKALQTFREIGQIYPRAASLRKSSARLLPEGDSPDQRDDREWQKRADVLSATIGAAAGRLSGAQPSGGKDYGKARLMLNDPKHQATVRRLQAEAMLNRLMQADDVIGSYDPQSVADAWYELSESSPGVVNNLSLLRANLRRQLQGNLTPFEARDLVMSGINTRPQPIPIIAGLDTPTTRTAS
jgi:hypothetical protein